MARASICGHLDVQQWNYLLKHQFSLESTIMTRCWKFLSFVDCHLITWSFSRSTGIGSSSSTSISSASFSKPLSSSFTPLCLRISNPTSRYPKDTTLFWISASFLSNGTSKSWGDKKLTISMLKATITLIIWIRFRYNTENRKDSKSFSLSTLCSRYCRWTPWSGWRHCKRWTILL